jgi:hypothetical protein
MSMKLPRTLHAALGLVVLLTASACAQSTPPQQNYRSCTTGGTKTGATSGTGSNSATSNGSSGTAKTSTSSSSSYDLASLGLLATAAYDPDVKGVLASCATGGCHADSSPAAGIALGSYATAKKNIASAISSAGAKRMPPSGGGIPAADLQTLKDWQSGGFAQSGSSSGSTSGTSTGTSTSSGGASTDDDAVTVSYDGKIKSYLDKYCVSCHGASSSYGALDTYASASKLGDTVIKRINLSPSDKSFMPPGGSKLPSSVLSDFGLWQEGGYAEDGGSSSGSGSSGTVGANANASKGGC